MPKRVSLDQETITLNDLFDEAQQWQDTNAEDLTLDQVAILNLKRVIELKRAAAGGGGGAAAGECFICISGA